ncbi:MOSC domain-containing protein [Paraglaciecola aquimarina]|uniref:MOSC domain-containing protein n=1 Tax=Paraglaciecola algarum TaxID=3050085 RepID=A0ABS9D3Z9_9ALTE|nr:MOSC domain-containing protein [Paraglaciecola sp. G1-23]MCF2947667.1 MOSC domain-containing protein [Paraglaciecola sp. G1-23]
MKVSGLFTAKVTRIGPKNERTGIYKYPCEQAVIDQLGMLGDVQIDKRYHGGPERALHQYSISSYEKIIKAYPLLHKKAWPGSMGENLSIAQMHENNVCIGDTYQIGECKIQVSGPRMPCFKIAEKFNTPNLNKFVAKQAIHGWYYRVLKGGKIALNDNVKLTDRPNPVVSIEKFLEVVQNKVSDTGRIKQTINAIDLDPEWREKLCKQFSLT